MQITCSSTIKDITTTAKDKESTNIQSQFTTMMVTLKNHLNNIQRTEHSSRLDKWQAIK